MYGEGKTRGKATELGIAAATNQACAALLQPEDDPQLRSYVKHWFEYNYLELRKQAAGGVQPNLNLEMIRRLRIPIPPREEMLEIVTALGGHFDSFAATTYELERLNHDVAGLKQSVLKAAFGGHLVEHDERDESAGGLLARLNQLNQRTEAKIKRSQFQRASRSTEIAVE
jgi:type I restriction enzyme S subunit